MAKAGNYIAGIFTGVLLVALVVPALCVFLISGGTTRTPPTAYAISLEISFDYQGVATSGTHILRCGVRNHPPVQIKLDDGKMLAIGGMDICRFGRRNPPPAIGEPVTIDVVANRGSTRMRSEDYEVARIKTQGAALLFQSAANLDMARKVDLRVLADAGWMGMENFSIVGKIAARIDPEPADGSKVDEVDQEPKTDPASVLKISDKFYAVSVDVAEVRGNGSSCLFGTPTGTQRGDWVVVIEGNCWRQQRDWIGVEILEDASKIMVQPGNINPGSKAVLVSLEKIAQLEGVELLERGTRSSVDGWTPSICADDQCIGLPVPGGGAANLKMYNERTNQFLLLKIRLVNGDGLFQ